MQAIVALPSPAPVGKPRLVGFLDQSASLGERRYRCTLAFSLAAVLGNR